MSPASFLLTQLLNVWQVATDRSWAREHTVQRDEAWFRREIAPKLDTSTLSEIAEATGLSLAASSRVRAGVKLPHPRHWKTLRELVDS